MQLVNWQQVTTCVSLMLWIRAEGLLDTPKIKFIGDFFSAHDIRVIACVTCSTSGKKNFVYFCIRISEKKNRTRCRDDTFSFSLDTLLLTKSLAMRHFWLLPNKPHLSPTVSSSTYFKLGVFVDYSCDDSKQVFWQVSYGSLLRHNSNK
jgi:hypothetical protein